MVKELLERIEEEIKNHNEGIRGWLSNENESEIDIPYSLIVLEQHLSDDKYKELHNDLKNNEWDVFFKESNEHYINGRLDVIFDNEEINYHYTINLGNEPRMWGYCDCSEDDADYDYRYRCCGHGCDWTAPKFNIIKETYLGACSFNGDEHDYWDYKDKYNNVTLVDKEQQEKESKLKRLKEEMVRIQAEIECLES